MNSKTKCLIVILVTVVEALVVGVWAQISPPTPTWFCLQAIVTIGTAALGERKCLKKS